MPRDDRRRDDRKDRDRDRDRDRKDRKDDRGRGKTLVFFEYGNSVTECKIK